MLCQMHCWREQPGQWWITKPNGTENYLAWNTEEHEVIRLKLLKLYTLIMIMRLFLVHAERICWNKRAPFQTTQDSSY